MGRRWRAAACSVYTENLALQEETLAELDVRLEESDVSAVSYFGMEMPGARSVCLMTAADSRGSTPYLSTYQGHVCANFELSIYVVSSVNSFYIFFSCYHVLFLGCLLSGLGFVVNIVLHWKPSKSLDSSRAATWSLSRSQQLGPKRRSSSVTVQKPFWHFICGSHRLVHILQLSCVFNSPSLYSCRFIANHKHTVSHLCSCWKTFLIFQFDM